ncbi:hypothetical protein [Streptomyces bluensis]|uniref:hypothetical protein n=1 Tax=Streptomyces bluensis TaxID=33897 RepID=UPI00167B65D1|nr:hypothetical protein [Streptomyces bluensis]GGZ92999.1 hypothetical protein GCM10010344_70960 [Streptomyces bluensis]
MEPEEIAELRTMYIFTPPGGQSWGLTYESLEAKLRERNPDEFIRIDAGTDGPVKGSSMHFGITLDDEQLEGMALLSPEGMSVQDCTASSAATFAVWLRNNVAPEGTAINFNTEWGMQSEVPDTPVPTTSEPELADLFIAHIAQTGGLD